MNTIEVSVVVYEDGDLWVAQGIEFDIAARAPNISLLPRAFERALIANFAATHAVGRTGFAGIGPAPREFREMFERAHFDISERDGGISPPQGIKIGNVRLAEAS